MSDFTFLKKKHYSISRSDHSSKKGYKTKIYVKLTTT